MDDGIVVYTSEGWGPCHLVKVYLSRKGIPFTERNVSLEPAAQEALLKLGYSSTPVTVIKEQRLTGYNPRKLEAALVATGYLQAVPPAPPS